MIALSEKHMSTVVDAGAIPACVGLLEMGSNTDTHTALDTTTYGTAENAALALGVIATSNIWYASLVAEARVAAACVRALDMAPPDGLQSWRNDCNGKWQSTFEPAYQALVQLVDVNKATAARKKE